MINIKMGIMTFQVTRRCNQICDHCCKGKMQNIDMTKEIIDQLFESNEYQITEMTHFIITGGEPTLVPDVIEYLIEKILSKNILITKNVNIFTNGLIYSEKFINSIHKLINYLKSKKECENVSINFKISNDQFHKEISEEVLEKYKKVDFVSEEWLKPFTLQKNQIQNDGNAKENNLEGTLDTSYVPSVNYILKEENTIKIRNGIVISANGNVCNEKNGCATFEMEDEFAYGNLLEESFLDIISKFQQSNNSQSSEN